MLHKKISILYLLIAAIFGSALSVFALKYFGTPAYAAKQDTTANGQACGNCEYTISRLPGYKFTRPVYLAEPKYESNDFVALKSSISEFIEQMKSTGELDYASVYIKNLNNNDWMDINPEGLYHPGSLFKVITMITFLRMAETDLTILDKEVAYKTRVEPPEQTFNSKMIIPGHTYKIKELIYYMIVYSDNHATMLLHDYMDVALFQKTFTDLGLRKPDVHNTDYSLTVKEYSKFMSVLYDGGYLTIPASEYAISTLCEGDFHEGIRKELPPSLKVAHKFGEAGVRGQRELHECAIIYLDNKPYLLTIMTKGRGSEKLAEMISHISKMVYDNMAAQHS